MKNGRGAKQDRVKAPISLVAGQKGRDKAPGNNASREEPYRSQAERRAEGRTLREAVPRADHSGWRPHKDRRDPVDIVLASNEGRLQNLGANSPRPNDAIALRFLSRDRRDHGCRLG